MFLLLFSLKLNYIFNSKRDPFAHIITPRAPFQFFGSSLNILQRQNPEYS